MRKAIYIIIGVALVMTLGFVLYPTKKNQAAIIVQKKNKTNEPALIQEKTLAAQVDPNPFVQQLLLEYQHYINSAILSGKAPGAAVAIVRDSSIIFLKGFGLKESNTMDSVDVNSVFRLGSVSKCFAAVLTGTLVNDHVLQWDDKVTQYLPNFKLKHKENTDSLSLRHVLSHTTGLPYHAFTNMVEERVSLDTLLLHLQDLNLIGMPGKVYSYQNVGYSLIEKVIESATGKSYEKVMTEKLFRPLQMHSASASYAGITGNANVAQPHHSTKLGWRPSAISDTYYNVAPAGGVNASITDMGLWLKAMLGNQQDVLTNETVNEILTPQIKAISKNRNFSRWKRTKASYYAMGWRVLTFKNDTIDYHGGYVNGYRSEVALDLKNKMAICVLVNSTGSLPDQSIPQFFAIRSKYIDKINSWESQNKALPAKR